MRIEWWRPRSAIAHDAALTASAAPPTHSALTAAATAMSAGRERLTPRVDTWQFDVWTYYESLGEFRYTVDWRAAAMSRVRLRAARRKIGSDEPEVIDIGIAAELIEDLSGGVGGQSALMSGLTTLLDVPGEGWLVGEQPDDGMTWSVRSSEEIRSRGSGRFNNGPMTVEVIDDERSAREGGMYWRNLAENHMLVRVWRPDRRFQYRADSKAKTARATMLELDLVNRHITAQYLSRLASAGLVAFPAEVEFPVRPEFADQPNPFVSEWIETAREAIATPGTAAAVIPIPIKVPGEYLDKIKFIDFTLKIDEKLIEKRESAIKRLATQLDIPAEVLIGMGSTNHWSAWQMEESAIKIHIVPTAELICQALTVGYLHPRLKAAGEDPKDWLVWYDTSELTIRPDRSENAIKAYDRFELTGSTLRRELGFDEVDVPSDDELEKIILKQLARNPQMAVVALEALTGEAVAVSGTGSAVIGVPPVGQPDKTGRPPKEDVDTPDETPAQAARNDLMRRLSFVLGRNSHFREAITDPSIDEHLIDIDIMNDSWVLRHPATCESAYACVYTLATYAHPGFSPGTSGTYRCKIDGAGSFTVGDRVMNQKVKSTP